MMVLASMWLHVHPGIPEPRPAINLASQPTLISSSACSASSARLLLNRSRMTSDTPLRDCTMPNSKLFLARVAAALTASWLPSRESMAGCREGWRQRQRQRRRQRGGPPLPTPIQWALQDAGESHEDVPESERSLFCLWGENRWTSLAQQVCAGGTAGPQSLQ
jgi:hypothetical protein